MSKKAFFWIVVGQFWLLSFLLTGLDAVAAIDKENRVALVVGNWSYPDPAYPVAAGTSWPLIFLLRFVGMV